MRLRMQNAYGHGGTRLRHVLVSVVHELRPPVPIWQQLLLALLLLMVAVFFSRFKMPAAPAPRKTLIDISNLDIKAPPVQVAQEAIAEKTDDKPVKTRRETIAAALAPPAPPAAASAAKAERRQGAPAHRSAPIRRDPSLPPEAPVPSISRSSGYDIASDTRVYPHLARERRGGEAPGETGMSGGGVTRLRRETAGADAAPGVTGAPGATGISRGRIPSHALQLQTASERSPVPRRTSPAVEVSASAPAPRAVVRNAPVAPVERTGEGDAARERSENPGAGGRAASGLALSRGVSLMSLKICDSSLQQEEAIKAVLSVVGPRQSCSNRKGEFRFKGTRRVSSFNLMIFPAGGREPSQRCEELAYAYQCLTTK